MVCVRLFGLCDRGDECFDGSYTSSPSSSIAPSLSCRLVLLTNKAATVCLVCTSPMSSPSSSSLSSVPHLSSPSSSSSSLTSSSSYPSRLEGRDRGIGETRGAHVPLDRMEIRCSGESTRVSPFRAGGGGTDIGLGDWPPRVFLRRCCRFNHDLLRASIMRYARHFSRQKRIVLSIVLLLRQPVRNWTVHLPQELSFVAACFQ